MAVTKRNGRYQSRYRDEVGKQHAKMFDRKIDAVRWEADQLAKISSGTWVDPNAGKVTFQAYADEWLAMQPLRPTTLTRYEQSLRLNVYPRLGELSLTSIRRSHIQAMVSWLSERLSPNGVRFNVVVTGSVFKAAILDRRLAVSPCTGVKLPQLPKDRVEVMTTEQVLLLEEAMPSAWRAIVVLGAGAGLRQGEALGITQDRIDFLRRQLRVDRQLINLAREEPRLAPVKTSSSVRTIPLPQVVVDVLGAHFATEGCPYGDSGFAFPPVTRQLFSKLAV